MQPMAQSGHVLCKNCDSLKIVSILNTSVIKDPEEGGRKIREIRDAPALFQPGSKVDDLCWVFSNRALTAKYVQTARETRA